MPDCALRTIPFEQIPQRPALLDYLRDPIALRRFYPKQCDFHYEFRAA